MSPHKQPERPCLRINTRKAQDILPDDPGSSPSSPMATHNCPSVTAVPGGSNALFLRSTSFDQLHALCHLESRKQLVASGKSQNTASRQRPSGQLKKGMCSERGNTHVADREERLCKAERRPGKQKNGGVEAF